MKKHLIPIELGILIGVLSGSKAGVYQYTYFFSHHLYHTGLATLAANVNSEALRWAIVAISVYLGVKACARFGDKYHISAILLPLTLFCVQENEYFSAIYFQITHALGGYDKSVLREAINGGMTQIVAAALALILGLIALRWIRGTGKERQVGFISRIGPAIGVIVSSTSAMVYRVRVVFIPFVVAFILINLAAGVLLAQRSITMRHKPNVVFIMIDTLRADHVGCYGYRRNTTPNIDRFAKNAMRFEHAVAQAPFTDWSIPSFLSGKYPETKETANTTLQEFLTDQGFQTGGVVSNLPHYGTNPTRPHQRFGYWDSKPTNHCATISSPEVLSSTLAWLSKVKSQRFFLFSLFIDPHSPYIKHEEYDFDPQNNGKMPNSIQLDTLNNDPSTPLPCDLQHLEAVYDSEIAFTDEHVGQLLDKLKEDGVYDNSLIVLLADHGEEFKDHGALYHTHTLYHELLNVPLLIKLPNQHDGVVVKGYYSLVDLLPSIVAYMHKDPSSLRLQGKAINFEGLKEMRNSYIYSASHHKASVQNSTYKLIITYSESSSETKVELYRLTDDPYEKRDVSKDFPKVVQDLRSCILDHIAKIHAPKPGSVEIQQNTDQSPDDLKRLKTLGYLAN